MIKKLLPILLVLTFGCINVWAQKTQDKDAQSGIVYGHNHSYILTAPKGWVLDNEAGVEQGLHAVFYPKNSSWAKGSSVMYTNVLGKKSPDQPLNDVIEADIADFKATSPNLKVDNASDLEAGKEKKAVVKHFSNESTGNFEAVAYINESKVVVIVVLTSRTKRNFDSSITAFQNLVGSYSFLTDDVKIEK